MGSTLGVSGKKPHLSYEFVKIEIDSNISFKALICHHIVVTKWLRCWNEKWKVEWIRMVICELNIFDRQIWKEGYLPYHETNNLTEGVSHCVDLSPLLPGFWERYSAQKHWGLSRWRASLQSQTSEGQWPRRWPLCQPQEVNGEFKALVWTSYLKTVFEMFSALVFLVWTQLRNHWFPERAKC